MRKYNWHKEADVPAIRRERIKVKTMRKNIKDITFEDAKKVMENNPALEQKVFEYMMEDQDLWLDDILRDCHEDYEIYAHGYSYFRVKHTDNFLGWLEDVIKDYCLFKDSDMETINEYISKYEQWYEEDDGDKADEIYDEIEKIERVVEDIICKTLTAFYDVCYDEDNRALYFLDMMDVFIEDTDNTFYTEDYKVKQFIPKRIIPARVIQAETVALF